jgi:DedD protein
MDIALKQRLVGASVLIALAVIVLPMLLGGRPEGSIAESQKIELPPQPAELDFETRRYPIGESPPAAAPPPPREAAVPAAKPLPTPGSTVKTAPEPEVVEPAAAEEPPLPRPLPQAPLDAEARYVVQVASFGSADNANRLSEKLRGYGYSVLLDSIKSDVGTLHRVRVGPYPSEADANEAIRRLNSQVGDVKPRVMDLQPDKSAQVTTPSDPLVRWVVQVGSFSSAANADRLVERLRKDKLSAYREQVSGSGSVIYRVRVGPFLEREEAISVNRQVGEKLSLDGVVMSVN